MSEMKITLTENMMYCLTIRVVLVHAMKSCSFGLQINQFDYFRGK